MAGYGTDEGFQAWLDGAGVELVSDLTPAQLRQRGSAYVDGTYALRWPGTPTGGYAQERAWPRSDASDIYGSAIPSNNIPQVVIDASYQAAVQEDVSPGSLSVSTLPGSRIKREKVGPLETEYFDDGKSSETGAACSSAPVISAIEGMLTPLLQPALQPTIYVV